MCLVLGAAFVWQASHVLPYTRLWRVEVPDGAESDLTLLIANVEVGNTQTEQCGAILREHDADVVLLIEVDERWKDELGAIRAGYPFRIEDFRPDGLGIAL